MKIWDNFWGSQLPILRLTFLESSCNFRKFGINKNDGYFFRLDGSSGPMCIAMQYWLMKNAIFIIEMCTGSAILWPPAPFSTWHQKPWYFLYLPLFCQNIPKKLSEKSYIWYSLHLIKVHHIRILSNIVFFKVSVCFGYFEYFEFWTEYKYRIFKSNWIFLVSEIVQTLANGKGKKVIYVIWK